MKSGQRLSVLALLLGLLALAGAAAAFPFWLAGPDKRSNPHDPQYSGAPANTPVPIGSPTSTPTISPTRTASPTQTPAYSATISPTFTDSPTVSVTPTISVTFTESPTRTPSPVASPTPTFTNTPLVCYTPKAATTFVYDDMEAAYCYAYVYDDGSSPLVKPDQTSAAAHTGTGSYHVTYLMGTTWGAGFGFEPQYCPGRDARSISPTHFYIWVKTDQPVSLSFTFVESTAILGSTNLEEWSSPFVTLAAGNCWQLVQVPLANFALSNYYHVVTAHPIDDGVFQPAVSSLDIAFSVAVPGNETPGEFYFDDAGFSNGAQ